MIFPFFYAGFILIAAAERVSATFYRNEEKPDQQVHCPWIFFALFYGYLAIVVFSILEYFLVVKSINWSLSLWGAALFTGGSFLRRRAMADLGANWSLHTAIKKDHELVTSGVYAYLKHPYYLAVVLELAGVCLVANSFYSLCGVILFQFPFLVFRVILEEKVLTDHFGEKYRTFAAGKLL